MQKVDLSAICKGLIHLAPHQQEMLLNLLLKYEELFDGTLGEWMTAPVRLQLKPEAKPYHVRRAYPVPRVHLGTLKREVDRLCKIHVLKKQDDLEWASPSFIIPKQNNTV